MARRVVVEVERNRSYKANFASSAEAAKTIRETFSDRDVEFEEILRHSWPRSMKLVGRSYAIAYESDKWKPKDEKGRRERDAYKHIAESRNFALVRPGYLRDFVSKRPLDFDGETVSLVGLPMPTHYAYIGELIEANLEIGGEFMALTTRGAKVGASKILWSEVSNRKDEVFLFVYTMKDGVEMILIGDKLGVSRDGIIG